MGTSMSGKLDQNPTSQAAAALSIWLGELLEADMAAGGIPEASYPKVGSSVKVHRLVAHGTSIIDRVMAIQALNKSEALGL